MSETLRVYGQPTLESAPVLLAVDRLYDAPVSMSRGGITSLYTNEGQTGFVDPGLADLATNSETPLLRRSWEHPELRVILTVSTSAYRIVARRSAGIAGIADLRGKRIATVPRTSAHYFLHAMLATGGLTESDVTIVEIMPLERMPDALADGEVDAVAVWEPESENARLALGADAIELTHPSAPNEHFNLNTTAANLADPQMRPKIVSFVRAVVKAAEAIRTDPSDATMLVAASTGFAQNVVERSWPHVEYTASAPNELLDLLEIEERWVADLQQRDPRGRAELAGLIDGSVLEEALALDE